MILYYIPSTVIPDLLYLNFSMILTGIIALLLLLIGFN